MTEPHTKRRGCFSLFLFFALIVSLLGNLVLLAGKAFSGPTVLGKPERFGEEIAVAGADGSDEKIALIALRGLIATEISGEIGDSMVDDLRVAFDQATEDEKTKAILFVIDSPGGEVTASDQIYHAVRKAREKKPVVVWMNSVAASGGYYAAMGGSYLMANDTTITGSIGVIIQALNYQDLLGKVGLQAVVFKSGKFKDMLSGARPITDEEKAYVEGMIQEIYSKFVGIVAKERKLSEEQLRNGVADGRIVSGRMALQEKLIDATGQFEDAVAKARELGKAPKAAVVRYRSPFRFSGLLRLLRPPASIKVELPALSSALKPGHLYLLAEGWQSY